MSLEDLIDTNRRTARSVSAATAGDQHLELCAEQLADGARLVITVLDDLIAEHGDLPISDALADRLIESIGLLDRAQAALADFRNGGASHA